VIFQIPKGEAELLLTETLISEQEQLHQKSSGEEAELRLLNKKENRVAIGKPYLEDLSEYAKRTDQFQEELFKPSLEIDYKILILSCSFLPDEGCQFTWARFGVELSYQSEKVKKMNQFPIVHDMFPLEVTVKSTISNEISFNPNFKLKLKNIETGLGATKKVEKKEIEIYEPEIIAFGIGRPSIAWQFSATSEKGLWGNKSSLLAIVKTHKEKKIQGRFTIGAKINAGKFLGIPLRKRKDGLIDLTYSFE
jgi:hypothetical protein